MNSPHAVSKIRMGGLNKGSPDISTEELNWNHCTYQFPTLFSTTDSVNDGHVFFDKTIESVPRGGGDIRTKIGPIYSRFPEHSKPIKKSVENGLR